MKKTTFYKLVKEYEGNLLKVLYYIEETGQEWPFLIGSKGYLLMGIKIFYMH